MKPVFLMNGQIVLCKGDQRRQRDWSTVLRSLSRIRPGPSECFRGPRWGLRNSAMVFFPLSHLRKQDAEKVLEQIHRWQKAMYEKHGIHFVHASDEWYILAGQELPEEDRYDGYIQLENGVGMLRLLDTEVKAALEERAGDDRKLRDFLRPPANDVMLETLSIIAYKQPVTKAEIEKIRGVKCDHAVNKLVEYELVKELGRLDAPGRPILSVLQRNFSVRSAYRPLDELPAVRLLSVSKTLRQRLKEEIQMKLDV